MDTSLDVYQYRTTEPLFQYFTSLTAVLTWPSDSDVCPHAMAEPLLLSAAHSSPAGFRPLNIPGRNNSDTAVSFYATNYRSSAHSLLIHSEASDAYFSCLQVRTVCMTL